MNHLSLFTCCALAACAPVVQEQIVAVEQEVALDPVARVAMLFLFDTDPDVHLMQVAVADVGGLADAMEAAQTADGKLPIATVDRIAVASTYLSQDDRRSQLLVGGVLQFPDDQERGYRHTDLELTVYELYYSNLADRDDFASPTPRAVLTDILTDPRYSQLTRDDEGPRHLLVVQSTAFDDASSTAPQDLAAFEQAVTRQPGGVSFFNYRPQSPRCAPEWGPWSTDDDGHQITEALIAPYLLYVVDLCDFGRYGEQLFAHHGWTNAIDIELEHAPLPDSVRVFGVAEGVATELSDTRWALDPDAENLLQVGPPLYGFTAVRVTYAYEVE